MMHGLPKHPTKKILRGDEALAWRDGFALLAAAERQQREIEHERRSAREQGYREGFIAGRHDGELDAATQLERVGRDIDDYLAGLEPALIELSTDIVRRLLGGLDQGALLGRLVGQALAEARGSLQWRVRVATAQVDRVRAELEQFGEAQIDIEGDDRLADDRCLMVSPVSVIDLSLEAQLERIAATMREGGKRT